MKSFAILLIILNIGFFTWLQGWLDWMPWQPQDIMQPTQAAKPSKSDLPTLALLNEKIEKPVEKPVTVATAEQAKPEPVKPEVKAESPKTAKPETVASPVVEKIAPVEKPVVAAEKIPEPVKPEPAKVEKLETAPVATVEAPKVAVSEAAKTEKVEAAPVKTAIEKPTTVVETLASVANTSAPVSTPETKEIKKETKEKSEAMEIPAPAVITPENNPITAFVNKAKSAAASFSADKPSDTGISVPPKEVAKEQPIEQTATPTTTNLNPLPAEVLSAITTAKADTAHKLENTNTPNTSTQNLNSSSTLAKNSATMSSSDPVAAQPTKTLQAVKKEDKTDKMSSKSNSSSELCFVAGPYTLLSVAQNSAKWFRGKSKVQAEIQADDVPTVFWVYLPPYKNQKEANRQAQHLAHLGITDYVLVMTGKLKHAVSLGVYRDKASAQRRVDELHRKGYKRARIEKQRQGNKRYWLSVKMSATQKDLMASFKRAQKVSAIEVNVCE
jgi:hypothetical protein